MADPAGVVPETMRLDRFLWFVRVVKTRLEAQALVATGRFRIDGRAVDRAHCPVRVGQVLTFADARGLVRVLRVRALPPRRGPAPEARGCYDDLGGGGRGGAVSADNVSQQGRDD